MPITSDATKRPWPSNQRPPESRFPLRLTIQVLLQPSKTEGFGMPVLEAQLLGTPVVTTRFGAMADFTMHGIAVEPLQPHYLGGAAWSKWRLCSATVGHHGLIRLHLKA